MKRDVSWFIDLYHNGQLDLDPQYQRKSVWTGKDRKFFLDTIFRNYPCPAVFLHKEIDQALGRMIYHVVDGKQRLETLLLFTQNAVAMDRDYGDVRLNGRKWKNILNDSELKTRFLHYSVPVEFIDTADNATINDIFDRLNRNSRKLERQELRHAKYSGWFITTAETEAEKGEWERLGVVTKARMRRMKDVQCISELCIVLLKNRVVGYDQNTLDEIYAEYESPYETVPPFNEETFQMNLAFVKDYLLQMEACNHAITVHASGFSNFYSLWAVIALNQHHLEAPEIMAGKYAEFMENVSAIAKVKNISLLREYENDHFAKAYLYLKNSVHSSMDLPQREARHAILQDVLLGHARNKEFAAAQVSGDAHLPSSEWAFANKADQGEYILKLIMGKTGSAEETALLENNGSDEER